MRKYLFTISLNICIHDGIMESVIIFMLVIYQVFNNMQLQKLLTLDTFVEKKKLKEIHQLLFFP